MSFQAWKKKFLIFLTFLVFHGPARQRSLPVNCSIKPRMKETTIVYSLKRLTAFRDEGYFSLVRALLKFFIEN